MKNEQEELTVNAKIKDCGLFLWPDCNSWEVRIILELPGGGCSLTIPEEELINFARLFQDDMDIQNGVFLHNFEGRYIRVTFENRKAVAIYDLLDRECIVLDKESNNE